MRERKKKILSRIIKLNEYETAIETRTQPPRRGIDQFFKNVTVGTVVTDTIDPLRQRPEGFMYTVPPSLRFGISYFLSPDEHQSSGRIKDTTSLSDEAATRRSLFEIYVFCTVPRLSRSTGFYIGFTSTVSRTREKKNERVINAITRQR